MADIRNVTDPNTMPVQITENAVYRFYEDATLTSELNARRIEQFEDDSSFIRATLGFEMKFYRRDGIQEAGIQADSGWYFPKTGKLHARSHVIMRNATGEQLETSELFFYQDSSRIHTEQRVKITTVNGGVIEGRGLEGNSSFTRYRIFQPVGEIMLNTKDSVAL
jgi:LPS export ABC transporter protein LptC